MFIVNGQGLLLKARFADGSETSYARPFLIINIGPDLIQALNVSSIKGKEHKLSFSSNLRLLSFNPPFRFPSFVKLDELFEFENIIELQNSIVANGRTIHPEQLKAVLSYYMLYESENTVQKVKMDKHSILVSNPNLLTVKKTHS